MALFQKEMGGNKPMSTTYIFLIQMITTYIFTLRIIYSFFQTQFSNNTQK